MAQVKFTRIGPRMRNYMCIIPFEPSNAALLNLYTEQFDWQLIYVLPPSVPLPEDPEELIKYTTHYNVYCKPDWLPEDAYPSTFSAAEYLQDKGFKI